jgi:hypothetical protein
VAQTLGHEGEKAAGHKVQAQAIGEQNPAKEEVISWASHGGLGVSWRHQIWEELNGLECDSRMAAKEQVA